MSFRFGLGTLLFVGAGALLMACSNNDNIADGGDAAAGQAGAGGTAGSVNPGGSGGVAGHAGTGGQAGTAGSAGQPACQDACASDNATMCMGSRLIGCAKAYNGCRAWQAAEACPNGQQCNSDGSKCVDPNANCTADTDCGCGCGCLQGKCECTGAIPPSCTADSDCGPLCYGYACTNGKCGPKLPEPCVSDCTQAGAETCIFKAMVQCEADSNGCLKWTRKSDCPADQGCNSDGSKCVTPGPTCTEATDCGCGCGCLSGQCECTGALPDSCTDDAQCGPLCNGFKCVNGKCAQEPQPPPDAGNCEPDCTTAGDSKCLYGAVVQCQADTNGCLHWTRTENCPSGEGCNSDGTKCVGPVTTCTVDTDCGCGCGCVSGDCRCTGAVPPSCASDAECGPPCAGFVCVSGLCVQGPVPAPKG